MGFFNTIKEGIQKAAENIEKNQELKRKKTKILRRFSLKQLQYMAKNYGIRVEPIDSLGLSENEKLTIDDYIYCIQNELSYEEILKYGKKRNINLSDIVEGEKVQKSAAIKKITSVSVNMKESKEEGKEEQSEVPNIYNDIRQKIENFKLDFAISTEGEFEKHLYQFLKYNFPDFQIERQVPCGDSNDKIDLAIRNSKLDIDIGIELKIGMDKNHLRNARAQVEDYSKFFKNTMLVIFDIGNVNIEDYDDIIKKVKKYHVDTIIIEGQLTKRKSDEEKRKVKIFKELLK